MELWRPEEQLQSWSWEKLATENKHKAVNISKTPPHWMDWTQCKIGCYRELQIAEDHGDTKQQRKQTKNQNNNTKTHKAKNKSKTKAKQKYSFSPWDMRRLTSCFSQEKTPGTSISPFHGLNPAVWDREAV